MRGMLWSWSMAATAAMLAGCHSGEPAQNAAPQSAPARVVESMQEQVPVTVRATGVLHARESAVISAQVMGRILRVLVREGDTVHAGQTLAVLDDATLSATVNQSEAAIKAIQNQEAAAETDAALAASTLARYKQLQVEKSVSPQEMDEVTRRAEAAEQRVAALHAQSNAARAQENGARTMLGYARLHAPFTGVVTARMADPGTLATPGMPLLQIDQAGPQQLQVTVDESVITAVRKGMAIPVTIDAAQQANITGTVAEITPAADPASHSFLVKIDVPLSGQLHAGMYGTAAIAVGTHEAIVVPRSAVVMRGSLACAYVLDGNSMAELRYVTLGAAQGDRVEVLSGIVAGEKLVDSPADRELAGRRIEVLP
jgi:RND family efflux transporter MFP subunit